MSTDAAGPYLRLLHNLHRADLLSRRVADRQLSEQIGMGRAMFLILDTLAYTTAGGTSQQAIADQLGLTKAAVSRHIAAGYSRGWLSAGPSRASRREHSVALTPQGRELVERGRRHRAEAERQIIDALGAEQLQHAAQTLELLCARLDKRLRD